MLAQLKQVPYVVSYSMRVAHVPLKVVASGRPYNLQRMEATNLYTFLRPTTGYSWSFFTLNLSGSSHHLFRVSTIGTTWAIAHYSMKSSSRSGKE